MIVGERFDIAMKAVYGYKRYGADLAKEFDLTTQATNQYKKKEKANDNMRDIAQKKGISLSWLEFGEGGMFQQRASVFQSAIGTGINQVHGHNNDVKIIGSDRVNEVNSEAMIGIPFYSGVYASAGGGAVLPTSSDPAIMMFNPSFLKDFFRVDKYNGIHIITATGNSMEPKIFAGELLFINPYENENSSIIEGAIYVVISSGHTYVKRIYPNGKELRLVSDNTKISDIVLMGDEIEEMTIIGRVVGHFDKL